MRSSTSHQEQSIPVRDRRLILQVYDYWEAIKGEREYPLMVDLDIMAVPHMADNSFLIDINKGNVNASHVRYVGNALAEDCQKDLIGKPVAAVPRNSLMFRLSDQYLQIIANQAPMSFEAEFGHGEGLLTKYRGVMLPLSNTGKEIDFILGVINCRRDQMETAPFVPEVEEPTTPEEAEPQASAPVIPLERAPAPVWQDETAYTAIDHAGSLSEMYNQLHEGRGIAHMLRDVEERHTRTQQRLIAQARDLLIAAGDDPVTFDQLLADCGYGYLAGQNPVMSVLRLLLGKDAHEDEVAYYADMLSGEATPPDGPPSGGDDTPINLTGLSLFRRT